MRAASFNYSARTAEGRGVTQISRPFQIALAAIVLLAAVWFIALRGHSSSGESSSANTPPASSSAATAPASPPTTPQNAPSAAAKPSRAKVHEAAAAGVSGLTRTIDKARGAAKQSERNAQHTHHVQPQANTKSKPVTKLVSPQAAVERELKQGHTVIVLFWSPKGAVDVAVRSELARLVAALKRTATPPQYRNIAVHYSSIAEVGQYGSITRSIQILGTPTMLVIAPSGKTKTLTGLIDPYTVAQAIKEAHSS
jgi:hypothetical protein